MLVDLKADLNRCKDDVEAQKVIALIAIAERLDRLCDLVERAQRPDGTLKREIRL